MLNGAGADLLKQSMKDADKTQTIDRRKMRSIIAKQAGKDTIDLAEYNDTIGLAEDED